MENIVSEKIEKDNEYGLTELSRKKKIIDAFNYNILPYLFKKDNKYELFRTYENDRECVKLYKDKVLINQQCTEGDSVSAFLKDIMRMFERCLI